MSLYEIEALLRDAVDLWAAHRDRPEAADSLRTLVEIPAQLDLDAAAPAGAAPDGASQRHVYALGVDTMALAVERGRADLAYAWCAFLLNFWSHMPGTAAYAAAAIRADWFPAMRRALDGVDLAAVTPPHRSLTLYPEGQGWFEPEHDALVRAFFEGA